MTFFWSTGGWNSHCGGMADGDTLPLLLSKACSLTIGAQVAPYSPRDHGEGAGASKSCRKMLSKCDYDSSLRDRKMIVVDPRIRSEISPNNRYHDQISSSNRLVGHCVHTSSSFYAILVCHL